MKFMQNQSFEKLKCFVRKLLLSTNEDNHYSDHITRTYKQDAKRQQWGWFESLSRTGGSAV